MTLKRIGKTFVAAVLAAAVPFAAQAQTTYQAQFDSTLGTEMRTPQSFDAVYQSAFEQRIAELADGSRGRIGVAAVDLSTGQQIGILDDQLFPMASTSKIAIAATFLEGVEKGRWSLTSEFPLLLPKRSARFSSAVAPVYEGDHMKAIDLIEIMITRSSNPATDALLRVVGGPKEVNAWMRRAGIKNFSLDRDIATLVRDDGEFDPANHIDKRDSATPAAMLTLLKGLYQGDYLSASSRRVLLGAMSRTRTGKRRIPALMPAGVRVSHKTGSLNNTSSDIGILEMPDGRAVAVAIYVTGQGTRLNREAKIAQIARALHDGYAAEKTRRIYADANYGGGN
ncbi:serine hydrolase [Erythrobacter litoralis]|uniref:class A beta-lactamase-related serine hydrolase n=1 Tax=Erythrobacter litoralis TaxID=39960 RepID=UPI002436066C|nr:class A beta-lactamase-related serine hydrolase [Erythrobacter litoralis]MDG6079114.1 serine hydrolase [Erythrobacter litoralis]